MCKNFGDIWPTGTRDLWVWRFLIVRICFPEKIWCPTGLACVTPKFFRERDFGVTQLKGQQVWHQSGYLWDLFWRLICRNLVVEQNINVVEHTWKICLSFEIDWLWLPVVQEKPCNIQFIWLPYLMSLGPDDHENFCTYPGTHPCGPLKISVWSDLSLGRSGIAQLRGRDGSSLSLSLVSLVIIARKLLNLKCY